MGPAGLTRVALVGCGHIGGSLALALRGLDPALRVIGCDRDAAVAARALELGLVHEVAADVGDAVADVDVVVLAVPVRTIGALAHTIAPSVKPGTVVTDVGSTKAEVVSACEAALAGRARFVGAHPMAGTERSGPDAADGMLFRGRAVIVTPTPATDAAARELVAAMWRGVGARVVELAPDVHDRAVAALSHLPHIAAFALAGALADDAATLAGLAGGSFDSGTRVAASAPAAWVEILLENRAALLPWIDRFAARTASLRTALVLGDAAALRSLLVEAGEARSKIRGRGGDA